MGYNNDVVPVPLKNSPELENEADKHLYQT